MKRLISAAVAGVTLATGQAQAAVSDDDFIQLKTDLSAMAQRLSTVEAENANLRETNSSWTDKIKLKGDFRYRYEEIDVEGKDKRDRNRIRARAALIASLANDTSVGMGIATGGEDPVSTNQTLGGGGSTKGVQLDLAYFKWDATDNFYLSAGKIKNPFYKPQKSSLLWDGDYNPEGAAFGWNSDRVFVTVATSWLESDSKKANQQLSWGTQVGVKLAMGSTKLTTGVGYHDLPTKGNDTFFGDFDDFFGNSFECDLLDPTDCVYAINYEELEVFANLGMSVFEMPLNIFANVVQNQDAEEFDTGYIVGVKLGKAKAKGTWQVAYQYEDLEKDAVLGLLTDSDFAGGGTDGKGHKIAGAYSINKGWNVGVTAFVDNETGEDNTGTATSYDRLQIDMKFKY